jgi:DNA-binding CsgD family transcriptional regulator
MRKRIGTKMRQALASKNLLALEFNEKNAGIVDSLTEPLRENFDITHFGFIRMFENGQLFRIANNPAWSRKYFENEFYNDADIYDMKNIPLQESRFVILTGAPINPHCQSLCYEFNIWNYMLIYERFETHGDFWFFATTRSNAQIVNFYINNKNLLKHFTLYFKEKACDLLKVNEATPLITTTLSPLDENAQESEDIQNFINEISYHKYYLGGKLSGKSLSKREYECLFFFSQGRTMKEIAEKMKLSPRTVEVHINNIKIKTGCHTRGELISSFAKAKTAIV